MERNHQGLENKTIEPDFGFDGEGEGAVQCRESLGGLLRYYHRNAAMNIDDSNFWTLRRIFECGIVTDTAETVKGLMGLFDDLFIGEPCLKCDRRDGCPDPIC